MMTDILISENLPDSCSVLPSSLQTPARPCMQSARRQMRRQAGCGTSVRDSQTPYLESPS